MVGPTAHFLEPGRHIINNPMFSFMGFRQSTDEIISVGSKHRCVCINVFTLGHLSSVGSRHRCGCMLTLIDMR